MGNLTLSRKEGERLFIGTDVVVTVASIEGGKVRLAICCPRDVHIAREELLSRDEVNAIEEAATAQVRK